MCIKVINWLVEICCLDKKNDKFSAIQNNVREDNCMVHINYGKTMTGVIDDAFPHHHHHHHHITSHHITQSAMLAGWKSNVDLSSVWEEGTIFA